MERAHWPSQPSLQIQGLAEGSKKFGDETKEVSSTRLKFLRGLPCLQITPCLHYGTCGGVRVQKVLVVVQGSVLLLEVMKVAPILLILI